WTVIEAAEAGAGAEFVAGSPSVMRAAATWRRILVADFSGIEALLGWGGRGRRLPGGREGFFDRAKRRYPKCGLRRGPRSGTISSSVYPLPARLHGVLSFVVVRAGGSRTTGRVGCRRTPAARL